MQVVISVELDFLKSLSIGQRKTRDGAVLLILTIQLGLQSGLSQATHYFGRILTLLEAEITGPYMLGFPLLTALRLD